MSILPDIWYCGLHDYNKALVQNNQFVSQNRASYTDKWLETMMHATHVHIVV